MLTEFLMLEGLLLPLDFLLGEPPAVTVGFVGVFTLGAHLPQSHSLVLDFPGFTFGVLVLLPLKELLVIVTDWNAFFHFPSSMPPRRGIAFHCSPSADEFLLIG